ncbi:MAG: glycosyltransferase [Bacteroidota bacterium]|nr:glycosyltransferase [Bacteroidota bacterium]
MKKKVVIFIDVVAHKNAIQIDSIIDYGLSPYFFTSTNKAGSENYLKNKGEQNILNRNIFKRLKQVNSFLKKNKNNIHHIEIYPGDRSAFLYLLLGKLYRIKCICAERGDLLFYNNHKFDRITRFSMWFCYKFSKIVWYREPYMQPVLEKLNKNLFFLHNAVNKNPENSITHFEEKDITFLWLNRIIPERNADWFSASLKNPELKDTVNYLVGMVANSSFAKEQEEVINNKPDNLFLTEYCSNPESFYKRAKFFVLPAKIVFANNSLLEAMSYGIVPIVSDQPGTNLIVTNEQNGFVFNHNKKDFEESILKAFHLPAAEYNKMSLAAQEKIKTDFSKEKYYNGLQQIYSLIELK